MSLKSVVQQLRALPYTEMKALAGQLAETLEGCVTELPAGDWDHHFADALSSLPAVTNAELDVEQKYLADFFRKKRAITVTTAGGAEGPWTVACNDGIKVSSSTLRGAFSEFLDALAAYHALRK